MKIAVSVINKDINSEISDFFGRSPYFIIFEIKDKKIINSEIIENNSADQTSGAGVLAAQLVAEKKVEAVITGNVGPRALDVLKQFNIAIYLSKGKVNKSLEDFINKKIKKFEK